MPEADAPCASFATWTRPSRHRPSVFSLLREPTSAAQRTPKSACRPRQVDAARTENDDLPDYPPLSDLSRTFCCPVFFTPARELTQARPEPADGAARTPKGAEHSTRVTCLGTRRGLGRSAAGVPVWRTTPEQQGTLWLSAPAPWREQARAVELCGADRLDPLLLSREKPALPEGGTRGPRLRQNPCTSHRSGGRGELVRAACPR